MNPATMNTQLPFTNSTLSEPPNRSSQREEALANSECGMRNAELSQSLLTSAATRFGSSRQLAFTRIELIAILAALALLTLVVLPALAGTRSRSDRVICATNLRQIGIGLQRWGAEHFDELPQEVITAEGGTRQHPLALNVWLHLAWISNEVSSPKIYLCPSDTGKPARDFSADPTGGYLHPNCANRATTYFLGYNDPYIANNPNSAIAGDRNVKTAGIAGCSRFNSALIIPLPVSPGSSHWTGSLHGNSGNILTGDGRVHLLNTAGFTDLLNVRLADNSSKHIIAPR
jgi:hypothetical protein